jgi:CheY-like chemotaxis protein
MKKYTILCVDDDADDLQLLHETLKDTHDNFVVVEAHNGRQALELLQKSKNTGDHPCLIILDINMPVLNGKETLSIIKKDEMLKSIPVVVFTTSGSDSDKRFCDLHGVQMITKPPNIHSFKTAVQKLLQLCAA